jgi:hypothetical protein
MLADDRAEFIKKNRGQRMFRAVSEWGSRSEGRSNLLVLAVLVGLLAVAGLATLAYAEWTLPPGVRPF